MNKGYLSLITSVSLLVITQNISFANEDLDNVTVYGEAYRTTGTKSQLLPMEAPLSYEVYDREVLELRQVDNVNTALRYVSGVTPESRSSNVTIFDQYTIRGFQTYKNFYDGLPLQYDNKGNLAPQVDVFANETIEILKGPTSVLYGYAPPGGMVNQTSKQPQKEQQTLIRARIGTENLKELGLDSTGAVTDNVNYRIIALSRTKDGQQSYTEEERQVLAPSITWNISDQTSLNLNAYYQNDPEMIPSTPYPYVGTVQSSSDFNSLSPEDYMGDKNWNSFEKEVTMLGYKFNHNFTDNLSFLQNFRHTKGDAFQRNTYHVANPTGSTLGRYAYTTDEEVDGFIIDNQLSLETQLGNSSHNFLFGYEYQNLETKFDYKDTFGVSTPSLDLSNINNNLIDPSALPLTIGTQVRNSEETQQGIYFQDEILWNNFTILAGLRHDKYESTDDSTTSWGGNSITKIDQNNTSYRTAVMYKFDNGIAPYISYSQSFEPLAGTDSNGKELEPEISDQIEFGVKYQSKDEKINIVASYYQITKENITQTLPGNIINQIGELESKGYELTFSGDITDNLNIVANYSVVDAQISKNPQDSSLVGKTPYWVSDKQASLWGTYYFDFGLDLSAGVRYIGKSYADLNNTLKVPSYTLYDMGASYVINDNYRLSLSVTNLTDKEYVSSCSYGSYCWMGAQRSAQLVLHATF